MYRMSNLFRYGQIGTYIYLRGCDARLSGRPAQTILIAGPNMPCALPDPLRTVIMIFTLTYTQGTGVILYAYG